jgi:large subunit ribosomal protein L29
MAIIRLKEIQGMSSQDRGKKLVELRAELARIKTMVNAGGAVENPTRLRELRKTIAQILTIENEDKLGIRKSAKGDTEKKPKKVEKTVKKSAESAPKKEAIEGKKSQ